METDTETGGQQQWDQKAGLDIAALVNLMWWNWRVVVVGVTAGVTAAFIYLHTVTPLYAASMEVAAAALEGSSATLKNMGGIAAALGFSMPGGDAPQITTLYLSALTSDEVAATLLAQPRIARTVFAESWDAASGRWRQPPAGWLDGISSAIGAVTGKRTESWRPPDVASMRRILVREVSIGYQPAAPTVKITYRNADPAFARSFLRALHEAADNHLRQRTIARTESYIAYIQGQLARTSQAEQREIMIRNLSQQEHSLMVARAGVSYSVDIFSQAAVSDSPVFPRPGQALFVFGMLGVLLSGLVILIATGFGKTRRRIPMPWGRAARVQGSL